MENINRVSGSGVSLKTSTFPLVLMRTVSEEAVWSHCCATRKKRRIHNYCRELATATTTGTSMFIRRELSVWR